MNQLFSGAVFCSVILLVFFISACSKSAETAKASENANPVLETLLNANTQIAKYVVEIFEDSKGRLWFGTMAKGVARYDGKTLTYFSAEDSLGNNTVASIAEDREGNLWFGTHAGLTKYNGKTFSNFTTKDGLCHDRISHILIDKSDNFWIGTWGGVCRFDGRTFTAFSLPKADVDTILNPDTEQWVTQIIEDREGNIWFSRDGYGVCKYDGTSFTHFTKKNGLPSNNVQAIVEDRQGNIWFGSRVAEKDHADPGKRNGDGGLSRYDGKAILPFPNIEGLSKNDIYTVYEDKGGNIWIGANGVGVYLYDGRDFHLYSDNDREDMMTYGIQSILQDNSNRLWVGVSGGLFRLQDSKFIHITKHGPWN